MTGKTQVYLHLHSSNGHPIISFAGLKDNSYNVRISARRYQIYSDKDLNQVTLKVLRGYECLEVKGDDDNETFQEKDFFIYSTSVTDVTTLGFMIDVSSKEPENANLVHLGKGHIVLSQLTGSNGTLTVPLVDEAFQAIGTISVDYLLVKPWNLTLNSQSAQTRRFWGINGQKKNGYYMCGHRGAGESFGSSMPSKYPENTIIAFKAGHEMGMDFVEMDVQVSKDNVPVIFHDTSVKICFEPSPLIQPEKSKSSFYEIPVKDLTAEQLKKSKVWEWSDMAADQKVQNRNLKQKHGDEVTITSTIPTSDISSDYALFPTLEEALNEVPLETGFLIELKYPYQELNEEDINYLCMDKNQFVDAILQVVFEKAGERKILLGCFDPDVCTMCQLKQSKYPVLFITQGNNSIWDPYKDIRARSAAMAVAFCKSQNLDGIHIFSSVLFDVPEKIEKTLQSDLTLAVWGQENDDPERKKWLVEHGIHCVQVDNIFGSV